MMAEYLNNQPQGSIIAAAIADAISPNTEITDATFKALEAFGAKSIRQRNFRDSYALIGVKGGDAVENYTTGGAPSAIITRDFQNSTHPQNIMSELMVNECFRPRLQLQSSNPVWRLE
jgi:hypothetical protein